MQRHIRYNLVQGDRTTSNGIVVGANDARMTQMGVPLALEGDAVWCPACKTTGHILCVGPRHANSFHGRKDALDGDLCICRCDPPPRLIHSMTGMRHVLTHDELVAQGFAKHPVQSDFQGEAGVYDEAVYGRRFSGRLDTAGLMPRIATESLGNYEIFWGDDALARG
ncbi:PAAR domain-containing protein [Cupriavidus sp. WKF15]|uniref:PAAR domain-containing protein n=1 Tax=Cupriavidus sp. WKF15 TaxID=3032282 RepID=UPI0023E31CD7|nr:PAAR domain-containing protein [Cupriavidus sp. WKF15]WER46549.1 PAAR domain-containing protein [Cupriavidus sp. WKF15]